MVTRRELLAGAFVTAVTLASAGGSYLFDEQMRPAPLYKSWMITDLHAHPRSAIGLEKAIEMLSSPGVVGLAHIVGNNRILNYEEALSLPGAEELEDGLAKIESPYGTGYFTRTQEITGGTHHLLAVGWEGEGYFENYADARKAIDEIHRRKGLAILTHPLVTPNREGSVVRYRFLNTSERDELYELLGMVDEVEVFNAQCIAPTSGLIIPDMKKANRKAVKAAADYAGLEGIACSDARLPEQVKSCGIYLPEEDFCLERMKADIVDGNFWRFEHYVSRDSFLRGMF